ncbi:hypothetical protein KRX57_06140 [Weeksellaceae bacterium TAE3-ERU29]|nr:hypothetical protein [Weeksellaceae bacterium TAE3-ERU29]
MITEKQNKQVIDFLLSKELPIDILSELHDHILSQIHEYQIQGMSFDEAFYKTKLAWKEELTVKFDYFLLTRDTKIGKKIFWNRTLPMYKKSIPFSLPISLLILYILLKYSGSQTLWYSVIALYSFIVVGFFYYQFFMCKKYYDYMKKYAYSKLSIYSYSANYAWTNYILLPLTLLFMYDISSLDNIVEQIILVGQISVFIFYNLSLYPIYYAQVKFMETIDDKVKPYFPYLDSIYKNNEKRN